jgi:tRNA dimethylallyltransferase
MNSNLLCQALIIAGPTAVGKSAVAVKVAQLIGGEVINADAFQLYQGMDICTAKPSLAEQEGVPHHLLGVLPVTEMCDAQRFRELALAAIAEVLSRGRRPILVGGSGLYLKALTHGLAPLPAVDENLRVELAALSKEERVARLLALDPDAASNVALTNDRYVSRALEICILSGQPQSQLRRNWAEQTPEFMGVLLQRDREELYARINQRVLAMVRAGLVAEIAALGELSPTAAKAIGVREIRSQLAGECSLASALETMQLNSRHYAKRQMTWFRRETGFQTICLGSDSTRDFAARLVVENFPCLFHPPPFALSSST